MYDSSIKAIRIQMQLYYCKIFILYAELYSYHLIVDYKTLKKNINPKAIIKIIKPS